ncbi:pyridoxamine 5'-phosphate oxidase family protein [Micromonospora yasonensis]|nr:pyridoxamine 5'-phosphate oxidase family protein [Micromonospora yasonensis]MCW3842369.1 pyridoxamine 5'-phosphate oxidase family protein [Micromonospora yasonensis]
MTGAQGGRICLLTTTSTPGITLIKVHAGAAEYWDSPGENHEVSY